MSRKMSSNDTTQGFSALIDFACLKSYEAPNRNRCEDFGGTASEYFVTLGFYLFVFPGFLYPDNRVD